MRDRFLPCSSNLRWHSEHLESPKSSNSSSSITICPSAATKQPTIFPSYLLSVLFFHIITASICRKEKRIFTEPRNKLKGRFRNVVHGFLPAFSNDYFGASKNNKAINCTFIYYLKKKNNNFSSR